MMKNSKTYPWILVGLLWVVALLNYMDRQLLSTMRPSMQIDIVELQYATNFGHLMAIFLWVYGFMSPLSGMIADKVNRKWLIVGSLFVWSLVTFCMGYATSFNQLYVLRAIMGVSEALYIPAGLSLIADFHSPKTRSLAIGIHMTGLYIGQALGGFGATIASSFTWQSTFHAFGIIGIFYSFILILFLRVRKDLKGTLEDERDIRINRKEPVLKGLKVLLFNVSFLIILFNFMIPSLPGWAVRNWLPTLFSQSLNIEMTVAGPLSTITIALSSLIGVLLGGRFSDKWVQKNLKGRVYISSIGMGLAIPSLMLIGFGNSSLAIMVAAFCFGLGYGMFDANNMPILCQFVSSKYRATAYGIMNMAGVFGGAFITDLLGKSTDAGNLGRDFAFLGIIIMVAMFMQLYFLRPTHNDFPEGRK